MADKNIVSVYMSDKTKKLLDVMSEKLTHTKQGRSVTLDAIITHADENFTEIESYFKGMKKIKK